MENKLSGKRPGPEPTKKKSRHPKSKELPSASAKPETVSASPPAAEKIAKKTEEKKEETSSALTTAKDLISAIFEKKPESISDSEPVPTQCTKFPWIIERNAAKELAMRYLGGKWMMFFTKSVLDANWRQVRALYRAGKLPNVMSMKVSTAMPNPRSTDNSSGVIIFYVGMPAKSGKQAEEEIIKKLGEKLVKLFNYASRNGRIYYKADKQTALGTQAHNYLCFVECGKLDQSSTTHS